MKRVTRSSLRVETAAAALAMEQGEYVLAVLAEVTDASFNIRNWRFFAGQWKQTNALDARTLFDGSGVTMFRLTAEWLWTSPP